MDMLIRRLRIMTMNENMRLREKAEFRYKLVG